MEQETISHDLFHQHPLRRIPNLAGETNADQRNWCGGCWRYFLSGEAAYGCSLKCGSFAFHQECLEMPREIRHPLHPSHTLTLQSYQGFVSCEVCEADWGGMFYKCSGGCEVQIHMGCVGNFEIVAVDEDERMNHPSHPQHPLKKITSCPFQCHACGFKDASSSYICTVCSYWIHEKCALLPPSTLFPSHHHHNLSFSFNPPYEYIRYDFDCAICSGPLPLRRWVYHCYQCRYVVHINCATNAPPPSIQKKLVDDEKGITKIFPLDDIYGEIIRGFVKRERQEIVVISYDNRGTYEFKNHSHPLRFTTFSNWLPSSSSHHHNKEEEEDDDDDDDDDDGIPLRCDGCTLPIIDENSKDEYYEKGYMSCDECKYYFLHLSCFNLPPQLTSSPLHPVKDHSLELRKLTKYWAVCNICDRETNGLIYSCTECSFRIDIKCASLPSTIKHAAHPRHNYLELLTGSHESGFCNLCYDPIYSKVVFYKCDGCRFSVCRECVLLPAYNKHRLEKHRMPLTYNAYVNRPGDFYCSSCEGKMNPNIRMYHCRDCDQSFHAHCFPTTSGLYRNINFGRQQYVIPAVHDPHHPLRFQIITKKKRCDLCHEDRYDEPGFQCVSCNFVMCLNSCYWEHKDDFKAL